MLDVGCLPASWLASVRVPAAELIEFVPGVRKRARNRCPCPSALFLVVLANGLVVGLGSPAAAMAPIGQLEKGFVAIEIGVDHGADPSVQLEISVVAIEIGVDHGADPSVHLEISVVAIEIGVDHGADPSVQLEKGVVANGIGVDLGADPSV